MRVCDKVSCLQPVTEVSNDFIIDPSLLVQFIKFEFEIPAWIENNVYHIAESLKEFASLSAEREQYDDSFRKFFEDYGGSSLMRDWTPRDILSHIGRIRTLSTIEFYKEEHDKAFKYYYYTIRRKHPTKPISFDENHVQNYPVLEKMQFLIGEGFNYEDAFVAETLMLLLKTKQPLLMYLKRFASLLRNKITLIEPALGALSNVLGNYYSLKMKFENYKSGVPKHLVKWILAIVSAFNEAPISHPADLVAAVIDP